MQRGQSAGIRPHRHSHASIWTRDLPSENARGKGCFCAYSRLILAQDILQPENAYRRLVRVVHFLPNIACSRGRIRRPGATCEPATGNFSHNTHIQACHVELAPQIFSATVLFSAPLSRKHSYRAIGASLRNLPAVSDGETAITNTPPMRISRGLAAAPAMARADTSRLRTCSLLPARNTRTNTRAPSARTGFRQGLHQIELLCRLGKAEGRQSSRNS